MITENVSTLKIHKLTQEQYDRELEAGTLEENALYVTPCEEIDMSIYVTRPELSVYASSMEMDNVEIELENIKDGTTVVAEATHATSADAATKIGSTTIGNTTTPVYIKDGVVTKTQMFAGGTCIALNSNEADMGTVQRIYAPTVSGTSGQILQSNGDSQEPTWVEPNKTFGSVSVSSGALIKCPATTTSDNICFIAGDHISLSGDSSESGVSVTIATSDVMDATNPTGTGSFILNRSESDTNTIGDYSVAMGYHSSAVGTAAIAQGWGCAAGADYSIAEGYGAATIGVASHAEGYNTIANKYQHVQGHYNKTTYSGTESGTGTSTSSAFIIGNGTADTAGNAFRVTYAGKPYALSTLSGTGADYAEYFEWQDLNPNAEDRRGYFVTLDEDKIKIAKPNDYILGIISGLPSVVGNGDEDWMGKYLHDEFGSFITEEFEYETEVPEEVQEEVVDEETGEITIKTKIVMKTVTKTGTRYKCNPDYDPSLEYIQREDRPEWDAVGILGVLSVRDDGTCQVNGYCTVAEGGIATASETGYRVIKRVNDNIVKVILK